MEIDGVKHPDLALLEQPRRRGIVCLTLKRPGGDAERALCALGPFHAYAAGGRLTLLFEGGAPEALEATLAAHGLQAGLSGPFALPASAAGCGRKAELALAAGRRARPGLPLYAMDDVLEQALLDACGATLEREGLSVWDFADRRIVEIVRLDRERDGAYAETLWTYLRSGLNPRVAAERLGVHRNTVAYRMQRLQELFAFSFADMNTCFELLFSLWLLRGLGAREEPEETEPFDAARARTRLWEILQCADASEAPGRFTCVPLCVRTSHLADEDRAALILRLNAQLDDARAALAWDEDMVAAVYAPDYAGEAEALCAGVARAARCDAAIGQACGVDRLRGQIGLLRRALQAESGVVRARDLASTLFFMTMKRWRSPAFYVHESVIRVMDEDAERGSSLSRALYAYLLNFCDMKRAAQQLGIHRNTMEYQLRKIEALIGGTPSETDRFLMVCTYKLLALPEG